MLRIGTIYYSQNCQAYLPVTPTLRSRRLMACEIDGVWDWWLTMPNVSYCRQLHHWGLHLPKRSHLPEIFLRTYQTRYCTETLFALSNVKHSHSHSHQNDLWQPYDDILLAYLWQRWNHFHCTLKRTSLLCLMQVNVNKQLTTNILTHMITLNWRTSDTFHSFQTFPTFPTFQTSV